ncbi:MAG: hypothetical protein JRM77_09495 [Nitrososphaerota archaeon]|nr:hypothetical protein [Nitrososphaerota archaeon]
MSSSNIVSSGAADIEKTGGPLSQSCPKCGKPLVVIGDEARYLECVCGFKFDTHLSRETDGIPKTEVPNEIMPVARAWLKDPSLIGYLADAIAGEGSEKPLLGEDDMAVQMLLTLLARGSVEIRGQTGAGKNTLADHVLTIFPRSWWVKVGGLTDKSLRYLPEGVKILYVTERRGMESGNRNEESTAEYDVKVGISEGEISVATTERDPESNEFKTTFKKVEIESFVFTTTEVNAAPELENRLTVLNVRDDFEQNRLVRDSQLRAAGRFSWEKRDIARLRAVAAAALQIIRDEGPEEAIVPFAEALVPILSAESSIVRRNTPKILDLVKASAKLHYLQRLRTPDGRGVIAAPEDLGIALYTGQRSLAAILSAIPQKAGIVWEICKGIAAGHGDISVENILLNAGPKRPELGSRVTVRKAVRFLADRGVLTERAEKDGKSKLYELQAWDTPLVIEVDALLRAADALYVSWRSAYREQTEPDYTVIDAQSVNYTVGAPKNAKSTPDGSRYTLPGESKQP